MAGNGDGPNVNTTWAAIALLALWLGGVPVLEEPMGDERSAEGVLDAVLAALMVEAAPTADEVVCVVVRRNVDGEEQIEDPTPRHLARLQVAHPMLRPGSACRRARGERAVEASTGAAAVVLDVGPIEWNGEAAASVGGGFSRGGWGVAESRFEVVETERGWKVERVTRQRTT